MLFETGFPVRYHIPPEDVMIEVMEPSSTVTQCPYKGSAEYFRCESAATILEDIGWTYQDAIEEYPRMADYICFFNERVDDIFVDG